VSRAIATVLQGIQIVQGELKLSLSGSNRWAGKMERTFGFYYVLKKDKYPD